MARRGFSQKEAELFVKCPPLGFIAVGVGLIFPVIFLNRYDDFSFGEFKWLIFFGILSIAIGIIWFFCRKGSRDSVNGSSLNFEISNHIDKSNFYISQLSKTKKMIANSSERIKSLLCLNAQYSFRIYKPTQIHYYSCKNKREFDRMSINGFFYNCVFENYYNYSKLIQAIEHNKTEYNAYLSKAKALKSTATEELCSGLKISLTKFRKVEQKIFEAIAYISPEQSLDIYCKIVYVSPKGRNHYKNDRGFSFNELKSASERVKREKAAQETKEYQIRTERSKMSASLRYDILKRDGFKCQLCGATANSGAVLHVDHILPVSKGGKTEWSNLRTLCEDCNLGKSDKIESKSNFDATQENRYYSNSVTLSYEHTKYENFTDYDWEYHNKVLDFWSKALSYAISYIENKDLESLKEFVLNVWNTRDKKESAVDLHTFIECTVERLYPFRTEKAYLDFTIELCELDISNYSNYINECRKGERVFRIPTKYCILLEKIGETEKAVELCDYFTSLQIKDHGYESFEKRKQHLLRKTTTHSK